MSSTRHTRLVQVSLAAVAIIAAGCGGDAGTAFTAASPTSISAGSQSGAVIAGRVNSAVGAATSDRAGWTAARISTMATTSVKVTVVGSDVSADVDGAGQFTLTGVPPGDVRLRFSGSGIDATLMLTGVSSTDRIEIAVTLNGNTARLNSERRSSSSNGVLVQGLITSIALPARTFQAAGQTVIVPAGAVIRHGDRTLQFADLRVGDHIQVKGTRDGSTVTATEVKVESRDDDDEDDDEDDDDEDDEERAGNQVEVSGTVAGLTGTCPAIAFTLRGTAVRTDNRTEFKDACTRIRNDVRVEVKGARDSAGQILATRVELD